MRLVAGTPPTSASRQPSCSRRLPWASLQPLRQHFVFCPTVYLSFYSPPLVALCINGWVGGMLKIFRSLVASGRAWPRVCLVQALVGHTRDETLAAPGSARAPLADLAAVRICRSPGPRCGLTQAHHLPRPRGNLAAVADFPGSRCSRCVSTSSSAPRSTSSPLVLVGL